MLAALRAKGAAQSEQIRPIEAAPQASDPVDEYDPDNTDGVEPALDVAPAAVPANSLSKKEPFDINGLRQTGLYSEDYIQELLAGIPSELICDSGSQTMAPDSIDQEAPRPRLFARLPKRRRLHASPAAALARGDTASISSSNETANTQATFCEEQLPPSSYQLTPATTSSEEEQERISEGRKTVTKRSLQSPDALEDAEEEDYALDDEYPSRQQAAIVASRVAKPVKKHIDPGERQESYASGEDEDEDDDDAEREADSEEAEQGDESDSEFEDQNGDTEEDLMAADLQENEQLLSLSAVERLVKGVAEGNSFFGSAGLIAAVAGMGLYDYRNSGQGQDEVGIDDPNNGALSAFESAEMEEYAKLARWATTYPNGIETQLTEEEIRNEAAERESLKQLYDRAFQDVDFDLPSVTAPGDAVEAASAPSKAYPAVPAEAGDVEASPAVVRPDAFDANDKERWAYQEAKLASSSIYRNSAIIGSTNSKKRKVPSASIPSNLREAPALSRRASSASRHYLSSEDAGLAIDPIEAGEVVSLLPSTLFKSAQRKADDSAAWRDPLGDLINTVVDAADTRREPTPVDQLPSMASLAKGAQILAQALHILTLAAMPPGVYRRTKRKHAPSSLTYQKYMVIKRRKDSRLSPYVLASTIDTDVSFLPTPVSLLPPLFSVESQTKTPASNVPMTAKRAAKAAKKAAKAKLNLSTPGTVPSSVPVPRLPYLYDPTSPDRFQPSSMHTIAGPNSYRRSSHLLPPCPFVNARFQFQLVSRRFQFELEAIHLQKRQLLALLRIRRKDSLLKRKRELEEEKKRLSKVLADNLHATGNQRQAARKPQAKGDVPRPPPTASTQTPAAHAPPAPQTDQVQEAVPPAPDPSLRTSGTGKPPPKKGKKKKRSAYANANNVHHRQNYIPSRLPLSAGPARTDDNDKSATMQGSGLGSNVLPHDNDSDVFNFGADEWMCMFCEYELWYGNRSQVASCVKKRKKVLKIRQKALERAKGAVEGTNKKKGAAANTAGKANAAGKATLPGTAEQAQKAERAMPTPAPPSTPEHGSDRSAGQIAAAAAVSAAAHTVSPSDVASALKARPPAHTAVVPATQGISQSSLLSYHCLAKGLPQPVYHVTDMRDVIWHESDDATRDALGEEEPWQAVSIELNGDIYKRAILGNERRKFTASGQPDSAPPLDTLYAKEDIAERVLRYLLSEEKPHKALDGYVAKDAGIVIYRPGETEFVVNLKSALSIYDSAWSLLQEYCRLDGRQPPSFITEHISDRYIYSLALEDEKIITDFGGEDDAREDMSLRMLDTLQQQKSTKLSALIAKSKEERDSLKAETAHVLATQSGPALQWEKEQADAESLNDID